jgi:hypothetical protein
MMFFMSLEREQPEQWEQGIYMSPQEIQCRISENLADTRSTRHVLNALATAIVQVAKNVGE